MIDDAPIILSLSGVTKRFGALVANDGIDLTLRRGEILALLGENGAGKTTLMNILFGHYVADAGTVAVAGLDGSLRPLPPGSPHAALAAGIGMVHQHFALAENLSVIENVVLGTKPLSSPVLRLGAARARLRELMAESGLEVPLDRPVARLTVGERQRVEILKILYRGARILVLDEPTAVLTPLEVEGLFGVLGRLARGGRSVVFISHKLREVIAIAHRVAVLRGGRKVAETPVAGTDRRALATLMVGREIPESRREPQAPGRVVLRLDGVSLAAQPERVGLHGVSLTARAGEIVGIAGVSGNGQTALAALIAGTARAETGMGRYFDGPLYGSARAAVQAGVARIPEDRHHEGAVGSLSVSENLALETLDEPAVQRAGFLRFAALRQRARDAIAAFDIRCPGPDAPIRLLSGGNMQKVILARGLMRRPKLILASQPTRGLDVGAAAEVHRRLLAARTGGAAIVLISEDLDELLALCDRIAVMTRGRLHQAERVETLTLEALGLRMAGQAVDGEAA